MYLAKKVRWLNLEAEHASDEEQSMDVEPETPKQPSNNRNNKALQQKKRGQQPGDHSKQGTKKVKRGEYQSAGKAKDFSHREIMSLAKKVRWLNVEAEQASDEEQSMDVEPETPKQPGNNRNNKALQRKK